MEVEAMARFDAGILQALRDIKEVAIRTEKHPKAAVVIWVVVADDEVFVRSVRGAAGRCLPVVAVPASEAGAIDRASREYLRKYRASPYAQSMVRPEVLVTTLRLEPG